MEPTDRKTNSVRTHTARRWLIWRRFLHPLARNCCAADSGESADDQTISAIYSWRWPGVCPAVRTVMSSVPQLWPLSLRGVISATAPVLSPPTLSVSIWEAFFIRTLTDVRGMPRLAYWLSVSQGVSLGDYLLAAAFLKEKVAWWMSLSYETSQSFFLKTATRALGHPMQLTFLVWGMLER